MGKNNAKMFDAKLAEALRMPLHSKKVNENMIVKIASSASKRDFSQILRILDEQDACNRYRWYNLPAKLTSQELERMIYFKGQLAFFYFEELGQFYFMPYALDGGLDFYGRYKTVHPVPYASGTEEEVKKYKESTDYKSKYSLLSLLKLNVVYDVLLEDEVTEETLKKSCVLLHDYTKQLAQNIVPRSIVNSRFIDSMSDVLCYLETSLLVGCGTKGYKVQAASEVDQLSELATACYGAAINKNPYIGVIGNIDFQELSNGGVLQTQDFLMAIQSLDNFRLSSYGIANGGFFEKKAHVLESENAMNESIAYNAFQDGLSIRQEFCNRVNAIWDLGIWCEPSESALGQDLNGDGSTFDEVPSIYETGENAPEGGSKDE